MKEIECKFCGVTFLSDHGKKYCSEDCRYKAKQEQWKESGIKRKRGLQGNFPSKICPICESSFDGNHLTKYCSDDCRCKAKREREKKYFEKYYAENKDKLVAKAIEYKHQKQSYQSS